LFVIFASKEEGENTKGEDVSQGDTSPYQKLYQHEASQKEKRMIQWLAFQYIIG
jgi:hypothetical protein